MQDVINPNIKKKTPTPAMISISIFKTFYVIMFLTKVGDISERNGKELVTRV